MFFLLIISMFTLIILYNFLWKRRNLPPGPTPLPFIGNGLTLKRLTPGYAAFEQWSKQYGPVFTFWLGDTPVVAVTDFNVMKEAFVNKGDATSGRDFFEEAFQAVEASRGTLGVTRSEGERWTQLRRFSLKVLRNLGMGRNMMEKKIMLEVDTVLETLDDDVTKDTQYLQNYHLNPLIDVAVGSVINQIAFGFRFYGENREQFFELKDIIIEQVHLLAEPLTGLVLSKLWLRHFPVFSEIFNQFKKRITRLNSFFNIQIEATMQRRKKESEKTSFTEDDTYFVDAFCMKWSSNLQINRKKTSITSNLHTLKGMCMELFVAGQETTSSTLKFVVLYMIVFPEVQLKMQEELDREVGDNEHGAKRISLADKAKLPYTNAVINETQRFCNLLPTNLLHRTTKEVEIAGFHIAKGTQIVPVISTVLYDEKIFRNRTNSCLSVLFKMDN